MPDTNAFPYPSGWCDVQSYFDNIKTIFVTKHIILNTSRSSIYISFYISSITQNQNNIPLSIPTNENPYTIISFEINDKTWNDKTLFSKMSQCGIDISSRISDSKKPGKRKEFFTLVNQLANQNLISYPEKPGFALVGGSDMDQWQIVKSSATKNFSRRFIPEAYSRSSVYESHNAINIGLRN